MNQQHQQIFKKGSKTYFYSSLFFPKKIKEDVFILYGFVRTADNFVDNIPQDKEGFLNFKNQFLQCYSNHTLSGNSIIDSYIDLCRRKELPLEWSQAFLQSMEMDLTKHQYTNSEDILRYIYGSAEVIGLMMSKILGLHPESYPHAKMQGRAMQYINFIRDIQEDIGLGRAYLPLGGSGLNQLDFFEAKNKKEAFKTFVLKQIMLYERWQEEAEKGYRYIPKHYLIPIKTASDSYRWTATKILKNPFVVYKKKMKPSVFRLLFFILKNSLILFRHRAIQ